MTNAGHAPGGAVVGVTIGMTILSGLAVISRLTTRLIMVRNGGIDDAFITAALVRHGMGRHQYLLSVEEQAAQLKPLWASIWVYNLGLSCTKFSILFQYLRIFPYKKFRQTCYGLIAVVFVYTCWSFFSAVFFCTPVAFFWNSDISGGRCFNKFAVWFANASFNILSDIAVGALPIPVLKELQLPDRQRYALIIVFALGGFTCIVSILRLQSLYVVSKASDVSWNNPFAAIWSSVELNTAILCSCLPTLKTCVSRYFPRFFGNTRHTHSGSRAAVANTNTHRLKTSQNRIGFDELSRGLSGRGDGLQKSMIQSRVNGSDDMDLDSLEQHGHHVEEGQIQVVTVVEQEEQRHGDGDSTKGLVPGTFYRER
ncbi:hypothetical protein LTR78_009983 [Recurvomyces mirabilis]|uniref:Rhodopsin domain-containing protein n=1 Tax=Recurvomyces mirabilis TaxID=574656 RepID=A0AAE0TQJ6_9PEZI|nr:hypothetical protein LTR78_009983 [Recurvomyces mirabilis]KAK5160324.1 hypothetical protein LTS14_001336 [Recurvomyces mirabilis]